MKTLGASHAVDSTQGQITLFGDVFSMATQDTWIELSKVDQHVYVLEPTLEEAIEALREFLTVAAEDYARYGMDALDPVAQRQWLWIQRLDLNRPWS